MANKKRHQIIAMEHFYRTDPNIREQNHDIIDNAVRLGLIGLGGIVLIAGGATIAAIPVTGIFGLQLSRLVKNIGVQTKYINESIEFANMIENEVQNSNEKGKQR